MADVSDPALKESYDTLTESKDDTNYIVWVLEGQKGKVHKTGSGGVAELRTELGALNDQVAFGAFLVTGVDNRENVTSRRPKYINFTWIGEECGGLKKARASVQKAPVIALMNGCAVSLNLHSADDLEDKALGEALLKAGAAHKPTHYDFMSHQVSLADLGL